MSMTIAGCALLMAARILGLELEACSTVAVDILRQPVLHTIT